MIVGLRDGVCAFCGHSARVACGADEAVEICRACALSAEISLRAVGGGILAKADPIKSHKGPKCISCYTGSYHRDCKGKK